MRSVLVFFFFAGLVEKEAAQGGTGEAVPVQLLARVRPQREPAIAARVHPPDAAGHGRANCSRHGPSRVSAPSEGNAPGARNLAACPVFWRDFAMLSSAGVLYWRSE